MQSNVITENTRSFINEDHKKSIKIVFDKMQDVFESEKLPESKLELGKDEDFYATADCILHLNGSDLEKRAAIVKKYYEKAKTEQGVRYTGAILQVLFAGIRVKGSEKAMFESYIYLKEVVPRLFYDKEHKGHTNTALKVMAAVHNHYFSRIVHTQAATQKGDRLRIKQESYVYDLENMKGTPAKDAPRKSSLPVLIAGAYGLLVPYTTFKTRRYRKYFEECNKIFRWFCNLDYKQEKLDDIRSLATSTRCYVSYISKPETEYETTYPAMEYLLDFIMQFEYGECEAMHKIHHTKMTEEEKAYFKANLVPIGKSLMEFLTCLPVFFYKLIITFIRKFYAPVIVILVLRFVFHIEFETMLTAGKGIFSAIGEIIGFIIHHPIAALIMLLFVILAPSGPQPRKTNADTSTWPSTDTTADRYQKEHGFDIFSAAGLPRDMDTETSGFSPEVYYMNKKWEEEHSEG